MMRYEKLKETKTGARLFKVAAVIISMVFLTIPASLTIAYAKPPTTISGSWTPVPGTPIPSFFDFRYVGANILLKNNCPGFFLGGPISGTFTQIIYCNMHYDDPAVVAQIQQSGPGDQNTNMVNWASPNTFEFTHMVREVTCTKFMGTVCNGGFEMLLECQGTGMPVVKGLGAFDLQGTWVITHGWGDLANLHGHGTWWHTRDMPVPFSYEGQVTFDLVNPKE